MSAGDGKAPFIAETLGGTVYGFWLKSQKPFEYDSGNAAERFRALFEIAGIESAAAAARALAGVVGKSSVHKWWNNPTSITWETFDKVARAAFREYEESQAAEIDRITAAYNGEEWRRENRFTLALYSAAECALGDEIELAMRRFEIAELSRTAEKLSAPHLRMLTETARAFLIAEESG